MTDDENNPAVSEGSEPSQESTTSQGSQPDSATPASAEPKAAPEQSQPPAKPSQPEGEQKTVPLDVLLAERRKYREKIRESRRQGQQPQATGQDQGAQAGQQYDPAYVSQLQTKVAIGELKDFARDKVKDYPDLPKYLKRAVISNPRGFIKDTTSDVEAGKLDIEEYLEDEQARVESQQGQKQDKKDVQVAGGNRPDGIQPGVTPKEIQEILDKPLDEISDEELKRLKEYRESHT